MKVTVLEEEKEKLKIELDDLTFANLLNENLWKQKVDFAACNLSHPYLANPVITVKAKNPKKAVLDAAEQALTDAKELRKQLSRG
ncbi:MAG: hypothetical protein HY364_01090 [Candidatus Aenigmarchaeota archaeon]|nr:hypothetical protein [Candidatus Aenigmarchaeota archaeon]